jgi:predicted RNA-binding protein with PUA-like domain
MIDSNSFANKHVLLLRKGIRLSIQPVTTKEFDIIAEMGNP